MEKFTVIIYDCGEVKEINTSSFEEAEKIANLHDKGYFSTRAEIYDNEEEKFIKTAF